MFPEINKIFRAKNITKIPNLKVNINNANLLNLANINIDNCYKDENENLIISDSIEKLELLGANFAEINNKDRDKGRVGINNIVKASLDKFKTNLENDSNNNITIIKFSNENRSTNPNFELDKIFFINNLSIKEILKKYNNKLSSGIDGIPNIALKKLPTNILREYLIIFNNALNNSYFPNKWKIATLKPLQKRKKILNY